MIFTMMPRIILVTFAILVASFIYFAVAMGVLEAFQEARFDYAFGQRVGFAASVLGAAIGGLLAVEANWGRLKRGDGSAAWASRLLALMTAFVIIAAPVAGSGFEALGSQSHYGHLGIFSIIPFYAISRYLVGLAD